MSVAVLTPHLRFNLVDMTDTPYEVGDGTAFPMQVTLAQIEEIFYRVKDAWFTGGEITYSVATVPQTFSAPSTAPTNRTLQIDSSTSQSRGYSLEGPHIYNGPEYDAGNGVNFSDIGDKEYAMWADVWNLSDQCVDAFRYDADDPASLQGGDSAWFGDRDTFAGAFVKVFRGNRVAVIKADPSHGFFNPANQFYLEIEFCYYDYGLLPFAGSTRLESPFVGDIGSGTAMNLCNYVIQLSDSNCSCPFYFSSAGSTDQTGSDFIHQAYEWWPYAKNSPAVPVWGDTTGLKL